jgi:oxygen-independent coproporphyrinogen-3 oxidase
MRHIYIHVPFCRRRCVYCDFDIAVRREIPAGRFLEAVLAELELRLERSEWDTGHLDTLYLGGGTPSLLPPATLGALVDEVSRRRAGSKNTLSEVTVEANPDDVTSEAAAAWVAAGIDRVSLGAQSFDDDVLRWMHRTHDAAAIVHAVREIREAGARSLSLDLIFGLPEGLHRDWANDLARALELEPDHLSVYGLTTEPRTALGRRVDRGSTRPAGDARYEREFLQAHETLSAGGFLHYEVSNYAKPGHRAVHNSGYWTGTSYGGLGPAAHSLVNDERCWNVPHWAAYEEAMSAGRDPTAGRERLSGRQRDLERLYLGLRTLDGVPASLVARLGGGAVLEAGELRGWLVKDAGTVRLTTIGWLRLDELVTALTTSAESG